MKQPCLAIILGIVIGYSGFFAQAQVAPRTTSGAIAIENLDGQIAQLRDGEGIEDLLLVRAQFFADYEALERAGTLAEGRYQTAGDLLRRATTRSAVHRFADALADLNSAEEDGASRDKVVAARASIFIATGHAEQAIPQLKIAVERSPGYASRCALAVAYAAVGRFVEADNLYLAALSDLTTTSPFPYAWVYFARGLMWTEQAGDPRRGEELYRQAVTYLPQFAAANIHLAELEAMRGDVKSAITRLEPIAASSNEPEALSRLGTLHLCAGDSTKGSKEIALARERYDNLLDHLPLAFADHAAEFYLGPGADSERAWALAEQNLANRETNRAYALAVKAARAIGRVHDAENLQSKMKGFSPQIIIFACPTDTPNSNASIVRPKSPLCTKSCNCAS